MGAAAAAVRVYSTGSHLFFLASLIAHYTVWDKCYVNTSGTQIAFFCVLVKVSKKADYSCQLPRLQDDDDGPMCK